MKQLITIISCIFYIVFPISLSAGSSLTENSCENATWIEIYPDEISLGLGDSQNVDEYITCNNTSFDESFISYYKFIVPSSGRIRFNNYNYSWVRYSVGIFDNCNSEPLFCEEIYDLRLAIYRPKAASYITFEDLPPGDTLIIQHQEVASYYPNSGTTVWALPPPPEPSANNNCDNPVWIDLKPNYESTNVGVNHSGNSLQIQPDCYQFDDLYADSYFQLKVPPSGRISFQHNYDFGIGIYDACNGNRLFCDYVRVVENNKIQADNLNPGDLVLLQVFQETPEYIDISVSYYPEFIIEPVIFDLKIEEVPPIPTNNTCSSAKLIEMTNVIFIPRVHSLDITPYCEFYAYHSDFRADAFYKFVVPSTGAVKFGREPVDYWYETSFDFEDVYFGENLCGFSIYNKCNTEPLFCFSDADYDPENKFGNGSTEYGNIVVDGMIPGDTLILQLYAPGFDQEYTINLSEAEPLSNNTCEEAIQININNNNSGSELVSVSLSQNTLSIVPSCQTIPNYGQFHPYSDAFYQLTVPENGGFEFELSSEIGIAVYDACNGNTLFCTYPASIDQGIYNLEPYSNVIIQLYDYWDRPENLSFSIKKGTYNIFCNINDWTALKAIYESTNGDNWINNAGWEQVIGTTPSDDCNLDILYGVNLNTEGRVSCIDLDGINDCTYVVQSGGNNLVGILPDEIGLLSELTELCLNYNEISGGLTVGLTRLSKLKTLLLHDNQLKGTISYSFFQTLNQLEIMFLSSNHLFGWIPSSIGQCKNLIHLGLFDNNFGGNIPPQLSELKNLQTLNLRNNQLDGFIPKEISNITTLNGLYLSNNQLSGFFYDDLAILCDQLTNPNTGNLIDAGNSFDAKWDDFCTCGAGSFSLDPMYINEGSPLKNVYQHKSDIIAYDFIIGMHNQELVTFSATNVTLEEGFEVKKGSGFLAEYNPCSGE